jgi:hypothetical protein
MTEPLDWRLETHEEPWMYGATFRWTKYQPPSPDWDHDHCALCTAKFMDSDAPDVLREGYLAQPFGATEAITPEQERTTYTEGYRIVAAPTQDEWVCPTCFSDFEARFGWKAEPTPAR